MNLQHIGTVILAGIFLTCFGASTHAQLKPTPKASGSSMATAKVGVVTSPLMGSVTRMMDKLNAMRFSGDPDFDYVLFTRTHHVAEVELLQEAVKTPKSDSLKQMMTMLISRKQKEIDQLEDALKQIRPSRANQAFVQAQNRKLTAMKLNFQGGTLESKLTGRVDEDYAIIMLDHQRDAVDMTQDYLKYGKNQLLLALARQILTNAQTDADQLKALITQAAPARN